MVRILALRFTIANALMYPVTIDLGDGHGYVSAYGISVSTWCKRGRDGAKALTGTTQTPTLTLTCTHPPTHD